MDYNSLLKSLEPFMENTDGEDINKLLQDFESNTPNLPRQLKQTALGITYHEACVLYYLFRKDKSYKKYAKMALLTLMAARQKAPDSARPIIDSYIASSKSLVASTTSNLFMLIGAIREFNKLIVLYSDFCYCPTFLQGSLLENLPNIFGSHKKATRDFTDVLARYEKNHDYCPLKVVEFSKRSLQKLDKS